jgi:hypothetical protein
VRTVKAFLIGGLATAWLIAAMAVPVSAADTKGTLAIVNGIPRKKVDVCINGKEVRSRLPYGGVFLKNVIPIGAKTLKFHRADPRTCRGTVLAQRSFFIEPGDDFTLVATKKLPVKVVMFENGFGEIPPNSEPSLWSWWSVRSASDLATNIRARYYFTTPPESPVTPAADPVWLKGDSAEALMGPYAAAVRATLPESNATIAGPVTVAFEVSHRYEFILVGTTAANARFVLLDRVFSESEPLVLP